MTSNERVIRRRAKFPISIKLVMMTILLLVVAVGALIYQSTHYFEDLSQKREIEDNTNSAKAKATEIDNVLQSLLEKAKAIALISGHGEGESLKSTLRLLIEQDHDLLDVDTYERKSGGFELSSSLTQPGKLEQFGGKSEDLTTARAARRFSFDEIAQGKVEVQKIQTTSELPIIGMAFPLARDELGRTNSVAVAYMAISKLQKLFLKENKREIFLLDSSGKVLSHPNENFVLTDTTLETHPMFIEAAASKNPRGEMRFEDHENHRFYHAAFAKTVLGPIVIAQLNEEEILAPARAVRRQSTIITGFVLSLSLLLVFLFSLTLVQPIERLAELIERVSVGDFEISARSQIKTRDEVGQLAFAFDDMVTGLKERDKVKNLFSKFHGSSVTKDLLSKEVSVGGSKKQVTVFFSDIRGFTAFSESRTPEQVVEMLNEYFAVMVEIINRNGGVVDKFIGDAIMAVWGVPSATGLESSQAVKACLEMRLALDTLNQKRIARGDVPIKIGMGLHAGSAISGTIGSEERMEYTVIGDTVNLTSRIEASTKSFGTDLLISAEIVAEIDPQLWIEKAGDVKAKGKTEPIALFKVKGRIDDQGVHQPISTDYSDYEAEVSEKIEVA